MNLINLKITLRSLMKNKFYTILSISGIALTFIFISMIVMFVRQTTGNYPPEVYKDRTIAVYSVLFQDGNTSNIDSARVEYYRQLKEPEYIAFLNWQSPFIFNGHKVIWTPTAYINSDFFNIFHFKFISGRPFDKTDEEAGRPVLVMAKGYAEDFFGRTDVLGEKIEIQGHEYSIIGIFEKPGMQSGFSENNLYIPRAFNKYMPQRYTGHNVYLKARDKEEVKVMSDELNRLHQQLYKQGVMESQPIDKEWNVM